MSFKMVKLVAAGIVGFGVARFLAQAFPPTRSDEEWDELARELDLRESSSEG